MKWAAIWSAIWALLLIILTHLNRKCFSLKRKRFYFPDWFQITLNTFFPFFFIFMGFHVYFFFFFVPYFFFFIPNFIFNKKKEKRNKQNSKFYSQFQCVKRVYFDVFFHHLPNRLLHKIQPHHPHHHLHHQQQQIMLVHFHLKIV